MGLAKCIGAEARAGRYTRREVMDENIGAPKETVQRRRFGRLPDPATMLCLPRLSQTK